MEQVARLLAEADLEAALVRLWILAGDGQRLVEWEHEHYRYRGNDPSRIDALVRDLQNKILAGVLPTLAEMHHNALALILAIDSVLANQRRRNHLLRCHQIGGRQYWLVRQWVDWRSQTALRGQRGNLLGWFSYHTIIPAQINDDRIEVKLYQCNGEAVEFFHQLLQSPDASIKIWIGHFADGADVLWDKPRPIAESCRSTAVADGEKRLASVRHQLHCANQAGAHFVVFPEFSLDLDQREQARLWLKNNAPSQLRYVVPGSFHEPVPGSAGPTCFNTAPLFAATGKVVFTHQKLRLFGKDVVAEDVSVGKTLHVLATPIGCLTLLICKDFMDTDASVANLLQHVLVDWVLVPSFGDERTIKGHKARARTLAKIVSGTNSAVANSRNTAMEPGAGTLPGFGHRSGQDLPVLVPETGGIVEYRLPNGPTTTMRPKNAQKSRPD